MTRPDHTAVPPAGVIAAAEPYAYVIEDADKDIVFCTKHRHQAHEHINDAISDHDIEGAGKWRVVPVYVARGRTVDWKGLALEPEQQAGRVESQSMGGGTAPPGALAAGRSVADILAESDLPLRDYRTWIEGRGALGPGASPERVFSAGWFAGRRAEGAAPTAAQAAGRSGAVRAGWRLVPIEPTEHMVRAGCLNQATGKSYATYTDWWNDHSSGVSERIRGYVSSDYRAMVEAAPSHAPHATLAAAATAKASPESATSGATSAAKVALEKDAARYRWLRDPANQEAPNVVARNSGKELDETVDAYMADEKPE